MHKKIDFTKQGGFPLTQEVLAFMQDGYSDLSAAIIGNSNNAIVKGCDVIEGVNEYNVTGGFIVFNGELLPFIPSGGGQDADIRFVITSTQEQLVFANGTSQTVVFNKYAQADPYGASPYKLSSLIRIGEVGEWNGNDGANTFDLQFEQLANGRVRIDGIVANDGDYDSSYSFYWSWESGTAAPANVVSMLEKRAGTNATGLMTISNNNYQPLAVCKCKLDISQQGLSFTPAANNLPVLPQGKIFAQFSGIL